MSDSILSSTSGLSSTKLASGLGKMFGTKVEELDRASNALESNPVASSRTTLKFNYLLWKKELELQKDELSTKWANAETQFQREHELKILDLRLSESKECSISHCIDLLNKQIEYAQAMKQLGVAPDPTTPPSPHAGLSAAPLHSAPPQHHAAGSSATPGPSSSHFHMPS